MSGESQSDTLAYAVRQHTSQFPVHFTFAYTLLMRCPVVFPFRPVARQFNQAQRTSATMTATTMPQMLVLSAPDAGKRSRALRFLINWIRFFVVEHATVEFETHKKRNLTSAVFDSPC